MSSVGDDSFGLPISRAHLTCEEIEALPPRPWLIRNELLRCRVTLKRVPVGFEGRQSALIYPVAVALGNGSWCGLDVRERAPVLVVTGIEDASDIAEGVNAFAQRYRLPASEIRQHIRVRDVSASAFFAVGDDLQPSHRLRGLAGDVKRQSFGLVVFSPCTTMHPADAESPRQMLQVRRAFEWFAKATDAAVLLIDDQQQPDLDLFYQGGEIW